ncbi:GNAT family N-acetyltransferase [Vibrio parahaemolyticus]|uniref:GNAT family N-acetyltransferase n=1 Tax=Vibrio TaxID=662 RepID=UPI00038E4F75|nr:MULTISPECIES: GNAT family N-acetyltransferase [Vibrio harveyi group]EJG0923742.1 GNAT family N-acetyltransferase [Vibrio parahaemolyticus O1:K68]EJG0933408.1 GNAT family N-acetyltransferase [Vibrio parahaemolyticus O1]EJG0947516.1 GNAT family N-acetyltransferase [Vibrio parahaemolyticus O10]EQM49606.1 acetyltransferase family protein [Vibrio parahaemolyticus VPCR-2010]EGQ9065003.1 GNAT family N-acetyltransferase [Vibrio parahaemolyticus]
MDIVYELVSQEDQQLILALGETVNEEFVIPFLSLDGQEAMRNARKGDIEQATNTEVYTSIKAIKNDEIIGYVAWRQGNYIAQLYVSSKYQKQGVGRGLITEMLKRSGASSIELKASVNAVGFYQRLGFQSVDIEQVKNGIRYVPMLLTL